MLDIQADSSTTNFFVVTAAVVAVLFIPERQRLAAAHVIASFFLCPADIEGEQPSVTNSHIALTPSTSPNPLGDPYRGENDIPSLRHPPSEHSAHTLQLISRMVQESVGHLLPAGQSHISLTDFVTDVAARVVANGLLPIINIRIEASDDVHQYLKSTSGLPTIPSQPLRLRGLAEEDIRLAREATHLLKDDVLDRLMVVLGSAATGVVDKIQAYLRRFRRNWLVRQPADGVRVRDIESGVGFGEDTRTWLASAGVGVVDEVRKYCAIIPPANGEADGAPGGVWSIKRK